MGGLSLSVAFAAGGKSSFPNMAKVSDDTNNKKDTTETAIPESSIVDEVIWVVGDACGRRGCCARLAKEDLIIRQTIMAVRINFAAYNITI